MEADASFRPVGMVPPAAITKAHFVTLVVEVGCSVPVSTLTNKANRWLAETTCQEVVLIKVSQQGNRLRGFIHRAGAVNPVQPVNFSGANCTTVGQLFLHIYHDLPLQNLLIHSFSSELRVVQQIVRTGSLVEKYTT
eukprot:TRINITY_DN164_c0_g1_i2.p1 TRINITY_DN164_c0_g1~~TRINITY_DN164_c0_g1_i2.p1  ORF type:complete len:137 (-),score=8.33 TRINITY_DN164_c0_g1_i2:348-758(-)